MKHPKLTHAFEVVSELPEPLRVLSNLAHNYRWTWHHETRELFSSIDKERYEALDHNPVRLLSEMPPEKVIKLSSDPVFSARLNKCDEDLKQYMASETWFDRQYPGERASTTIGYFCAEFGISESLPIYSGGLGVLAGDHLKAASDLGLPLVGVGLLYARGYFRQQLSPDAWQQEVYPTYDFYQMPLRLMRTDQGPPIRVEVEFPDRVVTCQVWRADVGRIPLYLLDSNVLENEPTDQGITDTLYGGDEEMRIRQEMILGIGGMRALRALGVKPTVCHMNEGHAAFLSIERIRQFMADHQCDFRLARQVVSAGNVFTTHTPVPAGFDLFPPAMLERYMAKTIKGAGIEVSDYIKMGRFNPENEGEAFNMALMAMETSSHVNGVSQLHSSVTRKLFADRWPETPEDEIPIHAITNGIHTHTWVSRRFAELYDQHLGDKWRSAPQDPVSWDGIERIPDDELWTTIESQRGDLIRFVRRRLQRDLERRQMSPGDAAAIGQVLDPRALTIGFARRFATYKRATLLLSDRERLVRLLTSVDRPLQIVMAGKSHPRDDGGKGLIQEIVRFIEQEGLRTRMVFLEDYDMRVARAMVQGVDLWLNNPRRPLEASGTSGMKVVPNGGLNCSVLDGWWDEAYSAEYGWAIGDRSEWVDEEQQDWLDSRSLYNVLESAILPKFYNRAESGLPSAWLGMVKKSIKAMAHRFSSGRMAIDYTTRCYMPASAAYQSLSSDSLSRARAVLDYKEKVRSGWANVRVVSVKEQNGATLSLGADLCVRASVNLGPLEPTEVKVEALVGRIGSNRDLLESEAIRMVHVASEEGIQVFEAALPCDRPGYCGYTVRVSPDHPDLESAHDLRLARWEA